MKTLVPVYYKDFKCIAEKCKHTCCKGWEIGIDSESLPRFLSDGYISSKVNMGDTPTIKLDENEKCPFLKDDGLCEMIDNYGEDFLCQICKDHPRFKNYWTGITEIGLGLVCEEAARIILYSDKKFNLEVKEDDFNDLKLPEDEKFLWDLREDMLKSISESGMKARLKEYLLYRHLPDALYDGLLEERIRFINNSYKEIVGLWKTTDGTPDSVIDVTRQWSYDVEYDDEELNRRLKF